MIEKILCSAIHYDNGKRYSEFDEYGVNTGFVLCGFRHHNIMQLIPTNVYFKKDKHYIDIEWNDKLEKHETIQGFLTSSGRFVDRKEALEIALKANQVDRYKLTNELVGLFSEDLY